jgi:hypothetical protein
VNRYIQATLPFCPFPNVALSTTPRSQSLIKLFTIIYPKKDIETLHDHMFTVLEVIQNSSLIFFVQEYIYELILVAALLNH